MERSAAAAESIRSLPAPSLSLRLTLEKYMKIEERGGWPTVPDGPALRVGSSGTSVARLKQRLSATFDLTDDLSEPTKGDKAASETFDQKLLAAVLRFQARHGLAKDGVVGRNTRSALNVPVAERIQQLITNMARLQVLPATNGERAILINVAGFDLKVVENDTILLRSPVIVGRLTRPTPIFSSVITKIVVNPPWRIPRSIATKDILPKLKRNPGYLSDQNIRVFRNIAKSLTEVPPESVDWRSLNTNNFPFLLIQDPGPLNALGRVKFFLPNEQHIFVHDTPARDLFSKSLRAFSSGCIRVERALELAEFLLRRDSEESPAKLAEALIDEKTVQIALANPVPIHIFYLTAWADENGHAHFRDDIYALDKMTDLERIPQAGKKFDIARIYDRTPAQTCQETLKPSTGAR